MSEFAVYIDAEGKPIEVGSYIKLDEGKWSGYRGRGVVIDITPEDGDVDDEGRSYGIRPEVRVRFFDGVEDDYSGDRRGWWGNDADTFEFFELLVTPRPVGWRRALLWGLRRQASRRAS